MEQKLRVPGSTENEFLGIGCGLQEFQKNAWAMRTAFVKTEQKSVQIVTTLRRLLNMPDAVSESLSGSRKINKGLHMLGITTGIECTGLKNGG